MFNERKKETSQINIVSALPSLSEFAKFTLRTSKQKYNFSLNKKSCLVKQLFLLPEGENVRSSGIMNRCNPPGVEKNA
jgi:hypothetical protein